MWKKKSKHATAVSLGEAAEDSSALITVLRKSGGSNMHKYATDCIEIWCWPNGRAIDSFFSIRYTLGKKATAMLKFEEQSFNITVTVAGTKPFTCLFSDDLFYDGYFKVIWYPIVNVSEIREVRKAASAGNCRVCGRVVLLINSSYSIMTMLVMMMILLYLHICHDIKA